MSLGVCYSYMTVNTCLLFVILFLIFLEPYNSAALYLEDVFSQLSAMLQISSLNYIKTDNNLTVCLQEASPGSQKFLFCILQAQMPNQKRSEEHFGQPQ